MNRKDKTVAVLGVGNLLMGDEGFGVHVIHHLQESCRFPETVSLHDVGTAGIYLGPVLEENDRVMVVDVLKSERPPGTLVYLDTDDVATRNIQSAMSPHQLGILEMLDLCRLRGRVPQQVEFLCAVPDQIALGLELSETLQSRVEMISREIVDRLTSDGYIVQHA